MHSQLRERIRLMRARLDNAAPVAEIRAESQLFVTPAPVCDRLVTLAEISNRDHILEPSAGTGAILRAIRDTAPEAMCDAVEINSGLVRYLRENFNGVRVQCGDFMEWQPVQYYSRIIMNPPFSHGQDIRHILRAFSLLRPGGVLVAVCLNGPRQQEKLLPFSDVREELNRPGFPGECFICELRLPDHRFRWKHNKLFLLLPEEYGPAFPAIVDCYTSPPT